MTSVNQSTATQEADKKPVQTYMGDDEIRIVALAAVESKLSRSAFIADAAVEKAVEVLKQKNASALDGTPYAVAKTA